MRIHFLLTNQSYIYTHHSYKNLLVQATFPSSLVCKCAGQTFPTCVQPVPGVQIVWIDAHNTISTTACIFDNNKSFRLLIRSKKST